MKIIDEDTLEIVDETKEDEHDKILKELRLALNCDPEIFAEKYKKYKEAEADFKLIYEPFKEKLIKIKEENSSLPNGIVVGGVKLTYVSPNVRSSIDSKKLKEEEPEIAKKYTKTTAVAATLRIE